VFAQVYQASGQRSVRWYVVEALGDKGDVEALTFLSALAVSADDKSLVSRVAAAQRKIEVLNSVHRDVGLMQLSEDADCSLRVWAVRQLANCPSQTCAPHLRGLLAKDLARPRLEQSADLQYAILKSLKQLSEPLTDQESGLMAKLAQQCDY
jgi:HEAT repeat protein